MPQKRPASKKPAEVLDNNSKESSMCVQGPVCRVPSVPRRLVDLHLLSCGSATGSRLPVMHEVLDHLVVRRSGADLADERCGSGGPVVGVLHEGVANRRTWRGVAFRLAKLSAAFLSCVPLAGVFRGAQLGAR